ncbi:MAG TPA: hypothetical protein VHZ02_01775 [Acidimicrobiales bacterium]|jgi:hypothetical protein|nr:hypothetical protein [Acidimicrobiales bacterium]
MALIREHGARLTGDEPHYLVAAEALGRFHTLHVNESYQYAISTRQFFPWGNPPLEQIVVSHGATFAYHNLGLPALLAIPTWIGGQHGAEGGLLIVVAALTVWLAYLVGKVSQVTSPWRVGIAGLFLSPAYLIASTQVYPDLISGLFIGILVMLIAGIEMSRSFSKRQLVLCGLLLGYLPWMHTQNVLFAAVLAVALVVVLWRTRSTRRTLPPTLGIAVLLWVLMAWYNLYVFGNLAGAPGETFSWGATAWTRSLALILGREQGLLIQFPVAVIGLAALWVFRRRLPVAVTTTVALTLMIIITSGAFNNSFGGTSFNGRFQWSACPVLLAFGGLYLLTLFRRRRAAAMVLTAGIAALYVAQLVPLLINDHQYYSYVGLAPQPPSNGWWGTVDHFIPSFNELTGAWTSDRVAWGVLCLVALVSLAFVCLARLHSGSWRLTPQLAGLMLLVGVTGGLTQESAAQVMSPLTFAATALPSQVGRVVGHGRTVSGPVGSGALIFGPGWEFPGGSYRAIITYRLSDRDPHAAPVDVILAATPANPRPVSLTTSFLSPRSSWTSKQVSFSIPSDRQLFVRVFWHGSGTLTVSSLRIVELSP